MIEEVGTVIAIEQDEILVETEIKTTCGSCQAQSDCGTGAISRALTPRSETLRFKTDLPVQVGTRVRLGIPEQALMKASLLLYIVPLLSLVISAALFSTVLPAIGIQGEWAVVLMTLLSTMATFVGLSRYIKGQEQQHYQPILLGVLLASPASSNLASQA